MPQINISGDSAIISASSSNYILQTKGFKVEKIKSCENYLQFSKESMIDQEIDSYALIDTSFYTFTTTGETTADDGGGETEESVGNRLNGNTEWNDHSPYINVELVFTTTDMDFSNDYDVWCGEKYVKLISTNVNEDYNVESEKYTFSRKFIFSSEYECKINFSTIGGDNKIYTYTTGVLKSGITENTEYKLIVKSTIDNININSINGTDITSGALIVTYPKPTPSYPITLERNKNYVYTIKQGIWSLNLQYINTNNNLVFDCDKKEIRLTNSISQHIRFEINESDKRVHLIYFYGVVNDIFVAIDEYKEDYLSVTEIYPYYYEDSDEEFTVSARCINKDVTITNFYPNAKERVNQEIDYSKIKFMRNNTYANDGLVIDSGGKFIKIDPTNEPKVYDDVYIVYERDFSPRPTLQAASRLNVPPINQVQSNFSLKVKLRIIVDNEKEYVIQQQENGYLLWDTINLIGDVVQQENKVVNNLYTDQNYYIWGNSNIPNKYNEENVLDYIKDYPDVDINVMEGAPSGITTYNPAKLIISGLDLNWRIPSFSEVNALLEHSKRKSYSLEYNGFTDISNTYRGSYNEVIDTLRQKKLNESNSFIAFNKSGYYKYDDETQSNVLVENGESGYIWTTADGSYKICHFYDKPLVPSGYESAYEHVTLSPNYGTCVRCVSNLQLTSIEADVINIKLRSAYQLGKYMYVINFSINDVSYITHDLLKIGYGEKLGFRVPTIEEIKYLLDVNTIIKNGAVLESKFTNMKYYTYDNEAHDFIPNKSSHRLNFKLKAIMNSSYGFCAPVYCKNGNNYAFCLISEGGEINIVSDKFYEDKLNILLVRDNKYLGQK